MLDIFGDFGFVGGDDTTANPYQDAQQCINYFPEVSPSKVAKTVAALLGTPGLIQLAAAPGGGAPGFSLTMTQWPMPSSVTNLPVRGCWVLPGGTQALVVIANVCYLAIGTRGSLSTPGTMTLTQVGTLLTSSGPVCIRDNGMQGGMAVIVDGTFGYLYQTSGFQNVVTLSGTVTNGSAVVETEAVNGLIVGASVSDANGYIAAGTKIQSIDFSAGTFTMSKAATGPATAPTVGASGTWTGSTIATVAASGTGTTATITFAAQSVAPLVGQEVTIAGITPSGYNGTFAITASTTTSVSYANTTTGVQTVPGTLALGGTATVTFATQAQAPVVGTSVTIAGVMPAGYNGTYNVLASTTSSVTYASSQVGSQTIAGTVTLAQAQATETLFVTAPAFVQITDPGFLGASRVAFIDGWWIFNQPGTPTFFTNAVAYSPAFNASNFALKDSFSDILVGLMESKEELWLIGAETSEIWYDGGGQYFPFQRLVGTTLQVGCNATYSISRLVSEGQEGLIWLGSSERGENVVVRTTGFTASTVSTPAVSNAIAQYVTTSDAIGYTYQEGGHEFYVLLFPTADACWVYDATLPPEMAWHQRLSYDPYAGQYHRHRSNCFMNFLGMRIVGDYQNGALYQLTRNAYTDAGWPIQARRRSPYIWNKDDRERVFLSQLQIDFAPGQGAASGMGANPQATLRISRDYGTTYGPPLLAPMGAIGQFTNRCVYRKLSWSRGAVAEVEVIAPVNRDITGVTLRASGT